MHLLSIYSFIYLFRADEAQDAGWDGKSNATVDYVSLLVYSIELKLLFLEHGSGKVMIPDIFVHPIFHYSCN